ncbi:MAG: DNA-directed RNA polymerase subunit beta' [Parcubacteria group bacterium Gr01-1014_73]|nr:MAG: DNA-directed RNA polymerase subunit beta' [Parcubacteria group bacterium Gr01-1014_73]
MIDPDFDAIKLKIGSPEDILSWSYGEILKPETINYRTQRAEKDGLFSERIFGPTKDWECYCGKYRRVRYKGVICDKCGVEVTRSIVRRERMGHIKLAAPVVHIWFLRSIPSKIGLFLDAPLSKIEKVVYYVNYIITGIHEENRKRVLAEIEKEFKTRKKSAKEEGVKSDALKEATMDAKHMLSDLHLGQILNETEFYNLARRFGDVFEAGSGAEAIRKILEQIDLKKLINEINGDLKDAKEPAKRVRLLRRLKVVYSMYKGGMRPEWMILTVLPILPPDLRPMVALDGGRFATSDLNDLYLRVINRNNRLKKLLDIKAPEVIVVNEKRMLQESVDALIDNGARFGSQQMSNQRRPLRSLADMLKGKQGRFRQNLLGKRVDYSGRSVIVVGPELNLDQCGLPKKMALEIFKPFVINKIIEKGMAFNIRNANRLIEQTTPEIWAILEEVIANKKVLLNRAPTLHRLGVQAFQPLLIEDLAIRIPPLVCPAFNADFDGDQMAVHLPLTEEAQKEAAEIMLSSRNLLKPATGEPIAVPSQDIVLGCYYLTRVIENVRGVGKVFASEDEAFLAYEGEFVDLNALIKLNNLETTVGRLMFNNILPDDFGYINKHLDKQSLSRLVGELINRYGVDLAARHLDAIKAIGFKFASLSGISLGMADLVIPKGKPRIIEEAEKEEAMVRSQYDQGLLTADERRNKIIEIWIRAKESLRVLVTSKTIDKDNPVFSLIDSGARGSWSQPVQMMGMKGLVQNPKGEIIELPIKSSLKEGHNVLEYFISTHGARKGTTDTALKTASAGYLARRLVDVSQDLVIQEEDCRTKEGIDIFRIDGKELGQSFASRIFARTALEDIKADGKIVVKAGEIIEREAAEKIDKSNLESIKLRSPITCKTLHGICIKCYGYDLGNNKPVKIGEAVGVVAAQSISEPGTQLTMRTFHTGGVAGTDITHGLPRVEELFEARIPKGRAFLVEDDGFVEEIEEKGLAKIVKIKSSGKKKGKILEYAVPRSAQIYFKVNDEVKKGDQVCEGNVELKELFALKGSAAVQRYIINEVQKIYASEGTPISNKHIEIIIRKMFSRVEIKESGDTEFVVGDIIDKSLFLEVNRRVKKAGGEPARARQLLRGITKVALSSESFLSAASFMETARVLVNSALEGKEDSLRGLKENVIIGRLIPVGTGFGKAGGREAAEAEQEGENPS